MGGCGSKSSLSGATAPVPYGRSSLRVNVGGSSSAGPHPPTPNVFAHLGIGGLDEDGNVKAMRAKAKEGQQFIGSDESAVKVAVLIRPLLPMETEKGTTHVIKLLGDKKCRMEPKPVQAGMASAGDGPTFEYDRVFNIVDEAASRELFRGCAMQITERFCQGFNACLLAYGQTGSGKTYTMGTGDKLDMKKGTAHGIIPRLIKSLFGYAEAASKVFDIDVKVQYIEIYNEEVRDLLVHAPGQVPPALGQSFTSKLEVREHASGEVYVDGANFMSIRSPADIIYVMEMGNAVRATAAHKMNEYSSRSHAIISIHLEQRVKPNKMKEVPAELHFLRSKLQLVDLAGSERAKGTGAEGLRFQEGTAINKSLLELGNVINALAEGGNRKHVPYRNSKLTRVLKDSLGGNAETLMLACVSPASQNYEQSLSTLRYAARARAIKNNLRLNNQMTLEEEVEFLRGIVLKLEAENASLRAQVAK